jgi:hypothetical protein
VWLRAAHPLPHSKAICQRYPKIKRGCGDLLKVITKFCPCYVTIAIRGMMAKSVFKAVTRYRNQSRDLIRGAAAQSGHLHDRKCQQRDRNPGEPIAKRLIYGPAVSRGHVHQQRRK